MPGEILSAPASQPEFSPRPSAHARQRTVIMQKSARSSDCCIFNCMPPASGRFALSLGAVGVWQLGVGGGAETGTEQVNWW